MGKLPLDVLGAVTRWYDSDRHTLSGPPPSALDDCVTQQTVQARLQFVEALHTALQSLMDKSPARDDAVIYLNLMAMEIAGRSVGTMHCDHCANCIESALQDPIKAFMAGYGLEAARNSEEVSPRRSKLS